MDVSQDNAKQVLTEIKKFSDITSKSIAANFASTILMMWGLICVIGFLGSHILVQRELYQWIWLFWTTLSIIGFFLTFLFCWRKCRQGNPIKNPALIRQWWRDMFFWLLMFVYIGIWMSIIKHWDGVQLNAFLCTAIMFAYVISGLYEPGYRFMTWLGMVGTALTLVGFYLIPRGYYCLWMAFAFGGALFITGLYLRLRWK